MMIEKPYDLKNLNVINSFIIIDNKKFRRVRHLKYLGVIIDEYLFLIKQAEYLDKKCHSKFISWPDIKIDWIFTVFFGRI